MTAKKKRASKTSARKESSLTTAEVLQRYEEAGLKVEELIDGWREAQEWPTDRLLAIPAYVRAIQETCSANRKLKQLREEMADPDKAGHLCLELLDVVADDQGGCSSTTLNQICEKAVGLLLRIAKAGAAHPYESAQAAGLLGHLPSVVTKSAIDALRSEPAEQASMTAQMLLDALVSSCSWFREAVKARPKQFEEWARSKLFWPSLRAPTDLYRDEFDKIRDMVSLGSDYGIKKKGAYHLEKPAVLTVAKCLLEIKWIRDSGFPTRQPDLAKSIRHASLPELTKDPRAIKVWWDLALKPLLEERVEDLYRDPNFGYLFKRAKVKTKQDNKKPFQNALLTDCFDALVTLASPVSDTGKKRKTR